MYFYGTQCLGLSALGYKILIQNLERKFLSRIWWFYTTIPSKRPVFSKLSKWVESEIRGLIATSSRVCSPGHPWPCILRLASLAIKMCPFFIIDMKQKVEVHVPSGILPTLPAVIVAHHTGFVWPIALGKDKEQGTCSRHTIFKDFRTLCTFKQFHAGRHRHALYMYIYFHMQLHNVCVHSYHIHINIIITKNSLPTDPYFGHGTGNIS